jgi:hypothetical protein
MPSPDSAYGVTTLVQLPPGTGVALAAAVDPERCAIGDTVTITATVTADGVPVTGAIARAKVTHPDGATTTTDLVLVDDGTGGDATAGEGTYTGVLAATTLAGPYEIVVSAQGTTPAFSREQLLQVEVAPSATTFSGTISDRGVDEDGDGRYDQLVVDVGVEVDISAAYRVYGTLTDGAVATTQPYPLEDFAPSPRFTVGGTVTGLVGTGLELELSAEGPPGPPPTTTLRPRNGSFTFFPRLVGGNPYEVRVKTQPTNPIQVCTITNASGTIEDANVTNIEAVCA